MTDDYSHLLNALSLQFFLSTQSQLDLTLRIINVYICLPFFFSISVFFLPDTHFIILFKIQGMVINFAILKIFKSLKECEAHSLHFIHGRIFNNQRQCGVYRDRKFSRIKEIVNDVIADEWEIHIGDI